MHTIFFLNLIKVHNFSCGYGLILDIYGCKTTKKLPIALAYPFSKAIKVQAPRTKHDIST